jgi:hypothetical protein
VVLVCGKGEFENALEGRPLWPIFFEVIILVPSLGEKASFILMRPHLPWERKLHFNNNINMILDN